MTLEAGGDAPTFPHLGEAILTVFGGQTLQRPLQEGRSRVTLALLQQVGAVAQPHGLVLAEALHHGLVQALCLLGGQRRGRSGDTQARRMILTARRGGSNLGLFTLGVDVGQLLVHGHGLAELHRPLKHFLQALLGAIHVLQVEQGHPHVQLLLLLPASHGSRKKKKTTFFFPYYFR